MMQQKSGAGYPFAESMDRWQQVGGPQKIISHVQGSNPRGQELEREEIDAVGTMKGNDMLLMQEHPYLQKRPPGSQFENNFGTEGVKQLQQLIMSMGDSEALMPQYGNPQYNDPIGVDNLQENYSSAYHQQFGDMSAANPVEGEGVYERQPSIPQQNLDPRNNNKNLDMSMEMIYSQLLFPYERQQKFSADGNPQKKSDARPLQSNPHINEFAGDPVQKALKISDEIISHKISHPRLSSLGVGNFLAIERNGSPFMKYRRQSINCGVNDTIYKQAQMAHNMEYLPPHIKDPQTMQKAIIDNPETYKYPQMDYSYPMKNPQIDPEVQQYYAYRRASAVDGGTHGGRNLMNIGQNFNFAQTQGSHVFDPVFAKTKGDVAPRRPVIAHSYNLNAARNQTPSVNMQNMHVNPSPLALIDEEHYAPTNLGMTYGEIPGAPGIPWKQNPNPLYYNMILPNANNGVMPIELSRPVSWNKIPAKPKGNDVESDSELENINFDDVTVVVLKDHLKRRGLPSFGKKSQLVERLKLDLELLKKKKLCAAANAENKHQNVQNTDNQMFFDEVDNQLQQNQENPE